MATLADHLPEVPHLGLRQPMPGEGYLVYGPDPGADGGARFGDEWTGWLDVRHPSLAGPVNTVFGYGRSDRFLQVQTSILTDSTGARARSDRVTDFTVANEVYMAQAGLSVLETRSQELVSVNNDPARRFSFPLSFAVEEVAIMQNLNLNRAAPLIDVYYANALDTGNLAETWSPSFPTPPANPAAFPDGIFMANFNRINLGGGRSIQGPVSTVLAHELYHFVGDGDPIHRPAAAPDNAHSADPRNLIATGSNNFFPGATRNQLAAGSPPWDIPSGTEVIGPRLATADGTPGGAPRVGGVGQITSDQVVQMFADPQVTPYFPAGHRGDNDRAGNRVDWDFVVDQPNFLQDNDASATTPDIRFGLEGLGSGADNHRGVDSLFWSIPTAPTAGPVHTPPTADNLGHDHRGLSVFNALNDFAGQSFWSVDVFSLDVQFADNDATETFRSTRQSILDYDLWFVGANDAIVPGQLEVVFIEGWAAAQHADDYVARWISPIPATGLLIRAHPFGSEGHDGSVHIDAIIASAVRADYVPESTTMLAGIGAAIMAGLTAARRALRNAGSNC